MARAQRIKYAQELINSESTFDLLSTDFSLQSIRVEHTPSFMKQFWLLFKRSMLHQWRKPHTFIAIFCTTVIQAFLICGIFADIGQMKFDFNLPRNIFAKPNVRLK